ncbi:MAG: radical SAM family heme chaperone HemW [Candidatus Caldatribacterium sp.]|nr:radical SAM family heme chaperone HemW [Candidatus Caldatribacterium sp.]
MNALGLYVHIPFCLKRCAYCDFVSYPWQGEGREFVGLLLKELDLRVTHSSIEGREIQSVYFGGGTPSLLEPSLLGDFLKVLRERFTLSLPLEVTLEANPETVTLEKLRKWRDAGITRLSIGVQTFQPRYLLFLGRSTSLARIRMSLDMVRKEEWKNWNIDLIYGLPLEDFDTWQKDVEEALRYAPPHISVYNLTLEPRVPLASFFRRHRRLFPSFDAQSYLFRLAERKLTEAGYLHYEVSNFAFPGFECRHNLLYWRNGEYIGLGPSAWTHLGGKRQKNADSLRTYSRMLQEKKLPVVFEEELSGEAKKLEDIMLLLRTNQGVPLSFLSSPEWGEVLREFLERGLLFVQGERLYPSSSGFLLLHQILLEMLDRRNCSGGETTTLR